MLPRARAIAFRTKHWGTLVASRLRLATVVMAANRARPRRKPNEHQRACHWWMSLLETPTTRRRGFVELVECRADAPYAS